jgi:hypothetical protein
MARLTNRARPTTLISMPVDRISEFMHELCRMDKLGGRCVRLDNGSWEVMDINQWTEEQHTTLRCKFPRVVAKVIANRKSLSGFSVLLQVHRVSHAWVSLLVCTIMVTSIAALSKALNRH